MYEVKKLRGLKRFISITLSIFVALLFLIVVPAFAVEFPNESFVVENGVLVDYVGEDGPLAIIEIPSNLGITTIGMEAFANTGISYLTIPEGVTTIEGHAFSNCNSITSIKLPSTLTTIGDYAFAYCDSLTQMYLPPSVTNLGESIFEKSDREAVFTIWGTGISSAAEYAAKYAYNYVNTEDVVEFGFYTYDQERWIPVYTHISEGYFEKGGYSILNNGELINSLPPYLTWSSDNESLASACLNMIVWHGEGTATIKGTDPLTGKYAEFELVVYYVDTELLEVGEVKHINLDSGMSAVYSFVPYISGEYRMSTALLDESILFVVTDSKGSTFVYGYDVVSACFNAGETYAIEIYNFGVNEKFDFIIEEAARETYTIVANTETGGAVLGSGTYQNGDLVMLQAIPDEGYMFEGWYENDQKISEATANYILAISADRTLKAKFVPYNFEVTDIVIEGIDSKGGTLSVTANVIGGSGTLKYAFYIYGNGKIYYANQNSSTPTFSCETMSAGTYNVVVYSLDETGKKVSYAKQFTIV